MKAGRPYRAPAPEFHEPALEGLGRLVSTHAPAPLHRALAGPVLIAALLTAPGFLAHLPLDLCIAPGLLVFIILAWPLLQNRGFSVELRERGLVLRQGSNQRALAFEDVDEIWMEMPRLRLSSAAHVKALRLVAFNGGIHRIVFPLNKSVTLGDAILRHCSKPLFEEAKAAFREGQTLTFGHVRVDRNGIVIGDKRAGWSELKLAVQERATLLFYVRSTMFAWSTVNLEKIPNPFILVELVKMKVEKARVDEHVLIPLAPDENLSQFRRIQPNEEENKEATRRLVLYGGAMSLLGFAAVAFDPRQISAYIPLVSGAVFLFLGLSRHISGPR